MVDNYLHKGLRQNLVKELRRKGIKDEAILKAIGNIPRHYMLDRAFEQWAYKDQAFPIDAEQTISQPYTVAFQTELLNIVPGDKVLEIGTGSGYQASVLFAVGAKVYTIERQKTLFDKTNKLLKLMGMESIRTLYGDGYLGSERFAPFDKILITAGAPSFPEKLFLQLRIGGIMVIPMGKGDTQTMYKYTRTGEKTFSKESHGTFSFVPMLGGTNKIPNK